MKEKQAVQNSENAQMLALDLQQKEQIDNKINYYKTMLKAYQDLAEVISKKVLFIKVKILTSWLQKKISSIQFFLNAFAFVPKTS